MLLTLSTKCKNFKEEQSNHLLLISTASHLTQEFLDNNLVKHPNLTRVLSPRMVCWIKPPFNWFKMNTDGASRGNPGLSGASAVVRDREGNFIRATAKYIGYTTSITAELWGIYIGLHAILKWIAIVFYLSWIILIITLSLGRFEGSS